MVKIKMIGRCIALGLFFLLGITDYALGEHAMQKNELEKLTIQDVPQQRWDNLAKKKIFFGHQSVGYNIIQGIEQVLKENPNIRLNIVKTTSADNMNGPVFAHDWIGSNMDPESKTKAFVEVLEGGVGEKADIAFMKMCYVDVSANTNVQTVFVDYKEKLAQLSSRFPEIKLIHVTVPLTAKPEGMQAVKQTGKNAIKKVMGKPVFDYKDNINRNQLNELLKAEYAANDSFFDLALLEAAGTDGAPSFFVKDGRQVMTLANEYTYDGGHLNDEGSKQIAEQLLIFLAHL